MSPSAPHPFHLAHLIAPAIDSALLAISDRGNQTEARRVGRSDDAETLIMSFQPRDAIDLMLTGQLVMFNEMLADGTRDVLRGMADGMKQRSLSTLVSAARTMQGHLDRLEKRGIQPHRTEIAAAETEARPAEAPRATPAPPPVTPPRPAAKPIAAVVAKPSQVAPARTTATAHLAAAPRAAAETSWLDAPHQEWRVETPADLVHQAVGALARAQPAKAAAAVARATVPQDPALPHQPTGYAPARATATAGAMHDPLVVMAEASSHGSLPAPAQLSDVT